MFMIPNNLCINENNDNFTYIFNKYDNKSVSNDSQWIIFNDKILTFLGRPSLDIEGRHYI